MNRRRKDRSENNIAKIESTLLRASLIELRLVADHIAGRLFSKWRRGRHKAVRRLLRHRDARRCQSLYGGRRRPVFRVKQETDGHPHGGCQHRHLQPQRPSPGETHPAATLRSFLYAPAAIDTFPRCDYRTSRAASKCRVTSATSSRPSSNSHRSALAV